MDLILNKIQELLIEKGIEEVERKSFIQQLQTELKGKKYGLVWENKVEKVSEKLKTYIPYLTEVEERRLICSPEDETHHLLIEGDNLEALTLLQTTHKGEIDVCYIDPPYNTENKDFVYNDKIIDEDDAYRHSKWLSFMEKRLTLAYDLLTDEGVIFISISDHELAQLKLLCDGIFGEDNFVNIVSVNMKNIAGVSGGGEDKRLKKNIEYLLIYAKNYSLLPIFKGAYEYKEIGELVKQYRDNDVSWKYTSVLYDEGEKKYLDSTVDGDGNEIAIYLRKNAIFKTVNQLMREENLTEREVYLKYGTKIFQTTMPQSSIRPRVMSKLDELGVKNDLLSIEYVPKTGRNKGRLYEQFYKGESCRLFAWLKDVSEEIDGALYKKDLQGTYWDFAAGTKNLSKEGNVVFPNGKKPLDFIKRIINLYPAKDITVLDFFAGSGTTGHAVLDLNKEDGGTRRFILCTNNEVSREKQMEFFNISGKKKEEKFEKFKKNKLEVYEEGIKTTEFQSLGICQAITYKRLKNVITDIISSKSNLTGLTANLHYYKINNIPKVNNSTDDAAEYLTKGIELISIKENAFNRENFRDYSILYNKDKVILVYLEPFVLGHEVIEISNKLKDYKQSQKIIYSTMTDVSISGIEVKEYPQEILEQIERIQQILKQWEGELDEE